MTYISRFNERLDILGKSFGFPKEWDLEFQIFTNPSEYSYDLRTFLHRRELIPANQTPDEIIDHYIEMIYREWLESPFIKKIIEERDGKINQIKQLQTEIDDYQKKIEQLPKEIQDLGGSK